MNSTSLDSANGPSSGGGDLDGSYAYSSIGSYFIILILITLISLSFYYFSKRFLETRQNSSINTNRELLGSDYSLTSIQIHHEIEESSVINSYPVILYSEAKQNQNQKKSSDSETITPPCCCSICLLDYKDTDWLRLLPDCCHFFHRDCIDIWLRRNLSCPVCRNSPLPTPVSTPLVEVAPLATTQN